MQGLYERLSCILHRSAPVFERGCGSWYLTRTPLLESQQRVAPKATVAPHVHVSNIVCPAAGVLRALPKQLRGATYMLFCASRIQGSTFIHVRHNHLLSAQVRSAGGL